MPFIFLKFAAAPVIHEASSSTYEEPESFYFHMGFGPPGLLPQSLVNYRVYEWGNGELRLETEQRGKSRDAPE